MNVHDRDQRDAAAREARAIVRAFDLDDGPEVFPDPTPSHRAAVQMLVGEEPAVCPHLQVEPNLWRPVFAVGWRPGAVLCGTCYSMALTVPSVAHCNLCGANDPPWAVVLTAGNCVASVNVCGDCHAALTGPEDADA